MALIIFCVFIFVSHASALNVCPNCGSVEVPYPFSTDENCGDTRYKIYCNNNSVLEFPSAEGFLYKILSINPTSNKLIINPPTIMQTSSTCYSSDFPLGGLRLDERSPFNISSHNTVILLNCSNALLRSPLNCSSTSLCRRFEDNMEEGSACRGTLCCHYLKDSSMNSHFIRARNGGCSAYTSVVDMQPSDPVEKWNYGIELQWLPPNN
ncbi:hypothetical protein TIFTF001_013173 [Ficus carica]|uniref:Wall-associated receptor kinase galacturonan-binding domain-containing protein n=1 Tax=Ficus carica TaxID=3494 RepID=A0AA88D701_FICCA|nr:hypothetical protein TIFTF001_013173 [Ficus carica]